MQNSARGSVSPGVTTPSQMALKTKKEPSAAAELFFWGRGYAADGKPNISGAVNGSHYKRLTDNG
jgi:hypothetical protein